MGVHREWRRLGMGQRLLDVAIEWAKADQQMEWIDLQVAGFTETGFIRDCFRMDGRQVDYLSMALPVR
jgi:GNAT superfamily N-acetyltransferase